MTPKPRRRHRLLPASRTENPAEKKTLPSLKVPFLPLNCVSMPSGEQEDIFESNDFTK
jgi:hypothetical protein